MSTWSKNSIASNLLFSTLLLVASRVAVDARKASQRTTNMKIRISIADKVVIATVADNATARDFVSVLPLSVSMKDLFGREKYGDLPKALSENGPRKNTYEVGEIAYWSPAHQFAVYYHQDGESIPSPGVIPIAKIDAGAEAFNVPGSVKVTIAFAK
jgi:hypothetical protein